MPNGRKCYVRSRRGLRLIGNVGCNLDGEGHNCGEGGGGRVERRGWGYDFFLIGNFVSHNHLVNG